MRHIRFPALAHGCRLAARALVRPPLPIPVPEAALPEGRHALLRLMPSLERIKIVVENGEWVSAKACCPVRPVRRTAERVWVEA